MAAFIGWFILVLIKLGASIMMLSFALDAYEKVEQAGNLAYGAMFFQIFLTILIWVI